MNLSSLSISHFATIIYPVPLISSRVAPRRLSLSSFLVTLSSYFRAHLMLYRPFVYTPCYSAFLEVCGRGREVGGETTTGRAKRGHRRTQASSNSSARPAWASFPPFRRPSSSRPTSSFSFGYLPFGTTSEFDACEDLTSEETELTLLASSFLFQLQSSSSTRLFLRLHPTQDIFEHLL